MILVEVQKIILVLLGWVILADIAFLPAWSEIRADVLLVGLKDRVG